MEILASKPCTANGKPAVVRLIREGKDFRVDFGYTSDDNKCSCSRPFKKRLQAEEAYEQVGENSVWR
jgi:hypothetical protein